MGGRTVLGGSATLADRLVDHVHPWLSLVPGARYVESVGEKLLVIAPPATYTTQWCEHFKAVGWEVEWISYGFDDPSALTTIPELKHRLPWVTLWNVVRETLRVRRLIRRLDPDVVHAHWITGPAWIAALASRRPLLATAWGSDVLLHSSRSAFARILTTITGRRAYAVTGDSQSILDALVTLGTPRSRVRRIVFGADPELFVPRAPDRELLRSFGIENDDPVVLSPRGIGDVYEPDTVLRGFARAAEQLPCNLLVRVSHPHIGDRNVTDAVDEEWERLRRLALDFGVAERVFPYSGVPREDLPRLLSSCAALVSVPRSDGTSVTLLEALFCELPVVLSELPANREWAPDERFGLVVPVGDGAALGDALVATLSDPDAARSRARRVADLARREGNRATEFERVDELYREAIEARSAVSAKQAAGQVSVHKQV